MRALSLKRWVSILSVLTLIWLVTLFICLLQGTESITLTEAFRMSWTDLSPGGGVEMDGSKGIILL